MEAVLAVPLQWRHQLKTMQDLADKHLTEPWILLIKADSFVLTSKERLIRHHEHGHLVAALDHLLTYQEGVVINNLKSPRMRLVELLKRWLRAHAVNANPLEDEVRRMDHFCRDLLSANHRDKLFPSMRGERSFIKVLAEVFDCLERQLEDVLKHERTCADLVKEVLKWGRNLVTDAADYMLLAATDLKQTDKLGSVEVKVLWESLPEEFHPLPGAEQDSRAQKAMSPAWKTSCGSLVAAQVCAPWARRLFGRSSSVEAGAADAAGSSCRSPRPLCIGGCGRMAALGRDRRGAPYKTCCRTCARTAGERHDDGCADAAFGEGSFRNSGLAGPFRDPGAQAARQCYLDVGKGLMDLTYLLGDVLTQFERIGDGLGDYGMIRLAPWLHPCLDEMVEKVGKLMTKLLELERAVICELVLPSKRRDKKVKGPLGSAKQSGRANECLNKRAVGAAGQEGNADKLLQALRVLKARSAPERLPHHVDSMTGAFQRLQDCLRSDQFHRCVGNQVFWDDNRAPLDNMGAARSEPLDNEPLRMRSRLDNMLALAGLPSEGMMCSHHALAGHDV